MNELSKAIAQSLVESQLSAKEAGKRMGEVMSKNFTIHDENQGENVD